MTLEIVVTKIRVCVLSGQDHDLGLGGWRGWGELLALDVYWNSKRIETKMFLSTGRGQHGSRLNEQRKEQGVRMPNKTIFIGGK